LTATRRSILLGAAAALPLVKARAQTPPSGPPRGQAILGFSQEVTVLNPLMSANEVDQGVWWNLFSPLWGIDPAGQLFPVLATAVPTVGNGGVSADGLTWRVELRDDVTWHDGRPFTAADVKFTLELIQNPKFRPRSRTGFDRMTDIAVEGNRVLTWRMKEPYSPILSILSWTFIVPEHVLSAQSDPNSPAFGNAPIGTGPFKWGERKTGEYVLLTANPHYFGAGPYLERLYFRYIPDLNALYTQFQTGAIDYVGLQGIPASQYEAAKGLRDRVLHVCTRGSVENLTLNLAHPALQDKVVRQALYHALDRQAIIDAIYYGLPKPIDTYLPKENWAYNHKLPRYAFDPEKAKALLDEAGWKPGADGIRAKDGVRLAFANSTTTGNELRAQSQQLIAQDWGKIGVALTINNMTAAVLWGDFWAKSRFDSLMTGTTYTIASDPDVLARFGSQSIPAVTGTGANVSQFKNLRVDALLTQAARAPTMAERKTLYHEAERVIWDELPMLPMFQGMQIEGTKAGLSGFANNVNVLTNTWNAASWFWT
jgi:peptide/nickel transport system substrate-binding protein